MNPRTMIIGYLLLQAVAMIGWWALLLWLPSSIAWFQPQSWPASTLLSFWLADGIVLIGGSFVCALLVGFKAAQASLALWMLAAAVWYPTLYCIGVSTLTGEAWLAAGLMSCMAGLTLSMATIYGTAAQTPAPFRAVTLKRPAAIAWTCVQVVLFWGVFLWILPMAIRELEQRIGLEAFSHPYQASLTLAVFAMASSLGLWSAWTMATQGAGTPLPTAAASKLVVTGPYRYVRNPMALAGIVQGFSVGWWLGSPSVMAYACAGILVWHYCVRPSEEHDMLVRFGSDYDRYRHSVRLWLPGWQKKPLRKC